MNRRGQIFTIVIIVMLSFLFVTYEIYDYEAEQKSIKGRVNSMNGFLSSVETNLERQLYIVGYRIIFLAEAEITETGGYVEIDDFFNEAFFNGTVNGVSEETFLTGATYDSLIESINDKARKINVNISFNNTVINVAQVDPWHIQFNMTSDFLMEDLSGLARWEKVQILSTSIPIEGFEDPVFIASTAGMVSRKINRTPYEGNYTDGSDLSNFKSHVLNGYYAENSNAPSFLKRLEGDLSPDPQGIESFVDIRDFTNPKTKSQLDYVYFSSDNPITYEINGMPNWFLMDNSTGNLEKYNVSGLIS